jgi:hypothetical protein
MTISQEQIEQINSLIADRVSYEEEHRDAGNDRAHMLSESWHSDHDNRLRDQLAEMGIDHSAVDFDQLAEDVIFWAEMVPSHLYDNSPAAGQILLDSFPVGEMEIEISAEELGCDLISTDMIEQLNRSCDAYFRAGVRSLGDACDYCYAYISSDRSWDAQISAEMVRHLIAELVEKAA